MSFGSELKDFVAGFKVGAALANTGNITLNTGTLVGGLSDYPTAVTYHERRRWLAGTPYQPQNIWATRNATESNLTASIPSR